MSFFTEGVSVYGALTANIVVALYYIGLILFDQSSRFFQNYCALAGYILLSLATLGQILNFFIGTVSYLFVFGFALVAIYFLLRCYDNLTEVARVN